MENLKNLLKTDLQSIGNTKRNPLNVNLLNNIYNSLKAFFNKSGTSVDIDTESGFNSLGFISIKNKTVVINNKIVFDLILKYSSYINIFLVDDDVNFEIGYTWLIKPDLANPVRDAITIKNADVKSMIFDLCDEINAITVNSADNIQYSMLCDEISIKSTSIFWELLVYIDSLSISNNNGNIELIIKIKDEDE